MVITYAHGGGRKNWKINSNQSEVVKQAWKDGKYNNRIYTDIEEKRIKSGNAWRGKHLAEKHKRNISESLKHREPWNKGKHLTEEQKENIRIGTIEGIRRRKNKND